MFYVLKKEKIEIEEAKSESIITFPTAILLASLALTTPSGEMIRKISACMLSSVFMMLLLLASKRSVRLPCSSSPSHQSSVFAEAVDMTLPRNTTRGLMIKSDIVSGNNITMGQILRQAGRKGLGGGLPGAIAGVFQVLTLMGLRTVINYQMRYGTPFMKAIEVLYKVS